MITIPIAIVLGLVVLCVAYLRILEHRKLRKSAESLVESHERFDKLLTQLGDLVQVDDRRPRPRRHSNVVNTNLRRADDCEVHGVFEWWKKNYPLYAKSAKPSWDPINADNPESWESISHILASGVSARGYTERYQFGRKIRAQKARIALGH